MKIGILGSGMVGQALGAGLVKHGHQVMLSSRDPQSDKLQTWADQIGAAATTGTFADAAAYGDLVVLATAWDGTHNAIKLADPHRLAHKTVIDVTNPLDFSGGVPPKLALGYTDSAGEQVQRWLPDAYVVKAFNIVGSAHMIDPDFPGGPPDMFICGNDDAAKQQVTVLLSDVGWHAIDLGAIDAARLIEPLAQIWIVYGFRSGGWNHAFKLLHT